MTFDAHDGPALYDLRFAPARTNGKRLTNGSARSARWSTTAWLVTTT
ncbi:hypothetical protein AKJ09_11427 [Labilithrix luteola]|uniref:Uncharacterized protein n=1 Tax=Labilithrix luteola TaxID=1391654 RepID=A0A0K1QG76_9BACT|nr:hypothetical protein AKJ09_11427 [Labilithrix luteola]